MDIDNLRKQFKEKKMKYSSSKNSFLDEKVNTMHIEDNGCNQSDNSDISIVFLANEYLYFCIGATGQKFKIALSKIGITPEKINDINAVFNSIDNLHLPVSPINKDKLANIDFYNSKMELLSQADICLLLHHNKESYLNCLNIINNNINSRYRICAEEQLSASGNLALDSLAIDESQVDYLYQNKLVKCIIGEGIIEIGDIIEINSYASPNIKDLIKGSVLLIGSCKGWLTDILILQCTSYTMSLFVKEKGKIRDVVSPICLNTTIPTREIVNIDIESNQTVSIEIDGLPIASNINHFYDKINEIQIDANNIYIFNGIKGNDAVSMPLSSLIDK